jgi:hypothetical protein
MPKRKPATDLDAGLRARLRTLAGAHSQAEIARRTGTSPANVNRYLRGNRVPASFCSALVAGLGVNPAWLIAGEGAMYLSDTAAGNERLAGNLLELVQAMNNVARLRLGSLAGRPSQQALRRLHDALEAHETLKRRLNDQSREVFAGILRDWRQALNAEDEPRAASLRKAAQQVARLCQDEALDLEHMRVEAAHTRRFGDLAGLIGLQRRVLFRTLGDGLDEDSLAEAMQLVQALDHNGRSAEAERLIRALLALAENIPSPSGAVRSAVARLVAMHGGQLLLLRRPAEGAARLHQAIALGLPAAEVSRALQLAQYFAGALEFERFALGASRNESRADWAVRIALFTQEPAHLERAARDYEAARKGATSTARVEPAIAGLMLRAIRHKDTAVLAEFNALIERSTFLHPDRAPWNVSLPAWACTLARHCGRRAEAGKTLLQADRALAATPPELAMPILIEATHYRNVLELCGPGEREPQLAAMRRRALDFLRRSLDQGCGFLAPLAQQAGLGA